MNKEMPEYYRESYDKWYRWASHIYDPSMRVLFFLGNGGFGGEKRIRDLVLDWVDPKPGERIIELCSGTGTFTIMLAEKIGKGEVTGIEISPAQLRIARNKTLPGNLTFIEGDAQDVPFGDGHFDKVVVFAALHEMPGEARLSALSEAYRVIKPGGQLVSFEDHEPSQRWRALQIDFFMRFHPEYKYCKNMLKSGLTNEIEKTGFKMIRKQRVCHECAQIVLAEKPVTTG